MMVRLGVVAAVLGWCALVASAQRADDSIERVARETFHNPIAQNGMIRHERAVRAAASAYRRALIEAHQVYLRDLQDALRAARQNRNTPEMGKLSAEIQRVQGDVDRLQEEDDHASGQTRSYEVFADRDWQPIRRVREGDLLVIKASGSWSFSRAKDARQWGPEGAGTGIGRLMGRIGTEEFEIGASRRIVAPADGMLEMRAHDSDYRDNSGKVEVVLTLRASRD